VLRNDLLTAELARLLRSFGAEGIPVVPLKGPLLAELLYGDKGLRVCSDLDILVPRNRILAAYDQMVRLGYQATVPSWFLSDRVTRNSFEATFSRAERSFLYVVELHWGILWEESVDESSIRDLWEKTTTQTVLGAAVQVLSPEWQLLFLAAHAARHNWQGLKWLVDIHEICLQWKLDWGQIGTTASRLGWGELVGLSLSICHRLLDTPLPPQFPAEPIPAPEVLFPARPRVVTALQNTMLAFRLTSRPSQKLRLLLRRLVVPTLSDAESCRLPQSLRFMYYFLRPLRLACISGKALLQLCRRMVSAQPG
jgi:hypothetical protein